MKKIIYDFGANEGQNIEYYLKNADVVVAVEANPILADKIIANFSAEIADKRLVVYNNCLVNSSSTSHVDFYRHKTNSGLSQFSKPTKYLSDFQAISVKPITYQEIVSQVGEPYFVKIDLEGLDYIIYKTIIESGIIPKHLSFENGTSYTKKLLTENSIFKSYNIVAFYNYEKIYNKIEGRTAGPFSSDIKSPWLNKESILKLYDMMPTTWFDVHLCTEELAVQEIDFSYYKKDVDTILAIKQAVPHWLRKLINTLRNKKPS